jgi:hypothetical protein
MKNRVMGFPNSSFLPMKNKGLDIAATNSGGSFKDKWLETTISGPKWGTHSAPTTSRRPNARKQNRPRRLPAR